MSVKTTNSLSIVNKNTESDQFDVYVRPSDWLPLPEPTPTTVFTGLLAITEGGLTYVAFTAVADLVQEICPVTVDWGDGTSETKNIFPGTPSVRFEKTYDYNTYDLSNTTLSSRGYKQAVVRVTNPSGEVTSFSLRENHSVLSTAQPSVFLSSNWLDVRFSNIVEFPSNFIALSGSPVTARHNMLESIKIDSTCRVNNATALLNECRSLVFADVDLSLISNLSSFFQSCSSLKHLKIKTSAVTNASSMFLGCSSLKSVPLFDTKNLTNASNMFGNCYRLESVPLFDTTNVTNMSNMFGNCAVLKSVPLFNTQNVTRIDNMFAGCSSLKSVPLFNTVNVTNMDRMFFLCYKLKSVPLFNTTNVTSMSNTFASCSDLESVPLFNTSNVTNMTNTFSNCFVLKTVPLFNTTNVTDMNGTFSGCESLESVPTFNTSNVTNMSNMFSGCGSLKSIPNLIQNINTSAATSFANNCRNLRKVDLSTIYNTIAFTQTYLTVSQIQELFTKLVKTPNATARTISVTGSLGAGIIGNQTGRTLTAGSKVIPATNTTVYAVGQYISGSGTGITTGITATADVATDTITFNNHQLPNGTQVAFFTLGTVTGVSLYERYFVVNSQTNTFQVSLTQGGAPINLTGTNSNVNIRYPSFVESIQPGVSITLNTPAATSTSNVTIVYRTLDITTAALKNWVVN